VLVVDPVNGVDSGSGPFKTIKGGTHLQKSKLRNHVAINFNAGNTVLDIQFLPGNITFTSALTLSSVNYTLVRFTATDPNKYTCQKNLSVKLKIALSSNVPLQATDRSSLQQSMQSKFMVKIDKTKN
jgi:hypothetical protein